MKTQEQDNEDLKLTETERSIIGSALNRIGTTAPDANAEWHTFSKKFRHDKRTRVWSVIWRAAAGVAACSLFLLTINNFRSVNKDNTLPSLSETTIAPSHIYTPSTDGSIVSVKNDRSIEQEVVRENEIIEFKTPIGKDLHATLSDGTKVWLNSGSSIKLYKYFTKNERRVRLSGEAYFEVQHNVHRPFVVETDFFTVNDIGTEFNINAYSKSTASVALVSGKVDIATNSSHIVLCPGQLAKVSGEDIRVSDVDTYPLTQRKKGLFYFHNATLKDIMAEIGRWYGKSVAFENSDNMNLRLHFVDERSKSLEQIVTDLNSLDGVQIFIGDDDITVR